ncbi:helix-turn-helix domain-containing protein [Sphingomonas sp. AOB5]|uniref:helix-turn-helix transcriptional regulator n=1 Tax=Sphingomonas sp. AOB5 TaxID=3034017 RepID=UPI0023F70F60|nr:helix-turn-helix domain-containing protein [Sphingomonas sp. AOB5]MDF7774289.1 helix-turn-helix domain-containing protein [Sphingomonas sp. AOB5]
MIAVAGDCALLPLNLHHMSHQIVLLRRKHALTQYDLADLIGVSQSTIGRLEDDPSYAQRLRLDAVLALQVIYGKLPGKLFPHLYEEVEDAVMRRVAALDRKLDGQTGSTAEHRRALLSQIAQNISSRTKLV